MIVSKLNIISIPKFIMQYLLQNGENSQLWDLAKRTKNILNESEFEIKRLGYRNKYVFKISKDFNIISDFFNLFSEKIQYYNGTTISTYSKELGIYDCTSNETFEAEIILDDIDKERIKFLFDFINTDNNEVEFIQLI